MTPIRSLLQQISARGQSEHQSADLVLGLPLEADDRTIYPVFLDPHSDQHNGAEPRQIGYLELGAGRSDYTSLEPDNRWSVAMIVVGIVTLFLIGILILRRAIR